MKYEQYKLRQRRNLYKALRDSASIPGVFPTTKAEQVQYLKERKAWLKGLKGNHNGFFKTGDYIEVSGKPEGIVVYADEKQFAIRPFYGRESKDSIHLTSFIKMYSNDAKHYKDNYWFKVIRNAKPPFEYKTDEIKPMILS